MQMTTVRTGSMPRVTRLSVAASAVRPSINLSVSSRRKALIAGIGALVLLPNSSAQAATVLCNQKDTEEEGDACRAAELRADGSNKQSYGDATNRNFEVAGNVPVAALDSAYVRDTKDLLHHIRDYTKIDMYSKGRPPLIKEIKSDGAAWVSKYARGGSVREASARKMYIAVDSLFGHFASNGLAPLPANKTRTILASLDEVERLLK